jgi:hypothetical protein
MPDPLPAVSVIVPMRNAERYVTQCLNLILRETNTVIGVIVVTTGPPIVRLSKLLPLTIQDYEQ